MINFFKRTLVKFLTRKIKLVSNLITNEHFIVSHISADGYVVLLTQYDSYLPIQYGVLKDCFLPVYAIGDIDLYKVISISDNTIKLSSGESVRLSDINEPSAEDYIDTSF